MCIRDRLYGYSYKNNTLALQDSGNTKYYTVTIKGSEIVISSADSDSPEILQYIKGPDFPTGGIIMGYSGIRSAYYTRCV